MTRTSSKNILRFAVSTTFCAAWMGAQPVSAQLAELPEVLACFYECKPVRVSAGVIPQHWMETTTLMVANENPPVVDASGAHMATHVAHMLILDGNEKPLLHTATKLTGWDLDEVHVCRTLRKAQVAVPPAGLVQIAIEPLAPSDVVYGGGVDVWIKNLLGRFPYVADDPFVSGTVTSLGKTNCEKVPPQVANKSFDHILRTNAPQAAPVLIERTSE